MKYGGTLRSEPKAQKKGFTIIEVVLFLALTGFIFLIIVFSINGRIAESQFTESMRDLQSQLQLSQSEAANGVGDGVSGHCTAAAGYLQFDGSLPVNAAGECTNLGKVIELGEDTSSTATLLGRRLTSDELSGSDYDLLFNSRPRRFEDVPNGLATNGVVNLDKSYRWNVNFDKAIMPDAVTEIGPDINAGSSFSFAFVRSPGSSRVLTLGYEDVSFIDVKSGLQANKYSGLGLVGSPTKPIEAEALTLCFSDADNRQARIIIAGGNQDNITLEFEGC